MTTLLLTTKLYLPPARPGLVPRPHLVERLNRGLTGKLTLISAPAGFGKTTLLSEWIPQSERDVTWLSLDEGDNDPPRFWSYFITSLQRLSSNLAENALSLLRSPQPPSSEVILTTLLNDLATLPEPFVLILDDVHTIENLAIYTGLTFLLDHLPPQMHLILTSRADPPLFLARLRARGQLSEIRAADLRFTPQEARLFLNQVMGLNLTLEQMIALETRTEGWIAGLQLAALALQNRTDLDNFVNAFTGSNRFVIDYLAAEVFARQPAHLQTFLLQTSILDRMCGSLCDAVTGLSPISSTASPRKPVSDAYSQILLETLERSNLFIVPLDNERGWYRYHHLFAEVMQARLVGGAMAETVVTLHQRASAWYEQEGLIDEAIRHALAAPDVERAAALIERYSLAMLLRSEVLLIRTWLAQLPAEVVQTRPRLLLAQGWVLTLTGHYLAAEQTLATPAASAALQAPDLPADIVGELALLQATITRFHRDYLKVIELARQALDVLPEDRRGLRGAAMFTIGIAHSRQGEIAEASQALAEAATLSEASEGPYITLIAREELAMLQARQGQLSQALQTCQANHLMARWEGRPIPAAGMSHIYIGEILYERNDLDGAAQALNYGINLLRGSIEQYILAQGYVALARVQQAQGDPEGAFATIQQGETWFSQMQVTDAGGRALLALGQARLGLRQGELAAPLRWVQSCQWGPEETILGYLQRLTLVRIRLAQGRSDPAGPFLAEANQLLSQLLVQAETGGWVAHLLEGLVLQALVYQAQGDMTRAMASLARALTLAEPEGYVRLFVDEGPPMAELLRQTRAQGSATNYVNQLLTTFPAGGQRSKGIGEQNVTPALPPSPIPASLLVETLTERELELLRLVAAGRSNQEIAQELILAVGTVKKHLNNIFGKLGVSSRTQAIVRGRELGLL